MSIVEVNVQLSHKFIATKRNRNYLLKITIFWCEWTNAIKISLQHSIGVNNARQYTVHQKQEN